MILGFIHSERDHRFPFIQKNIDFYKEQGVDLLVDNRTQIDSNLENIQRAAVDDVIAKSDIIYSNQPYSKDQLEGVKENVVIISSFQPFSPDFKLDEYALPHAQLFSMDMIPRTTLAQSMDVLSSMASISGYKAVLLGAELLPRYLPMLMTAAGTIRPATVTILGAGVAGLQAIATAKRLGAKVLAFDVRQSVKEQIESLGAKFVEVEGAQDSSAAGGYAIEQTEEFKQRQREAIAKAVAKSDIVISTAQLRGKKAPLLITEDMVQDMKNGSVIIDLASSTGGNCELTEDQKTVVKHGVQIVGDSHLYLSAVQDASMLLSNNLKNYLALFLKDGKIDINLEDEIVAKSRIFPTTN